MADVVSCVTMSDQTLVKGALLKSGSHLGLSYWSAGLRRDCIFVDTRNNLENPGDAGSLIAGGVLQASDIQGNCFESAPGLVAGRQTDDEITIFKNVGGAHLDVFTALALARA